MSLIPTFPLLTPLYCLLVWAVMMLVYMYMYMYVCMCML